MRTDVHFAALRAAAKVAFSMALLNGCSNAAAVDNEEDATGADKSDEALASSEAAMTSPDCPDHTCSSVLSSTFPKPGDYRWEREPRSKRVVECCKKELRNHEAQSKYRWDCCVAYNPETGESAADGAEGWACTPWGPPVPPSMERLAARRARRAARKTNRPAAPVMAVA